MKTILLSISIRYYPDRTRWREFFHSMKFLAFSSVNDIVQSFKSLIHQCVSTSLPWDTFSPLSSSCVVPRRLICMTFKIPIFVLSLLEQVIHSLCSIFKKQFYGNQIPLFKTMIPIWWFFFVCLYLCLFLFLLALSGLLIVPILIPKYFLISC